MLWLCKVAGFTLHVGVPGASLYKAARLLLTLRYGFLERNLGTLGKNLFYTLKSYNVSFMQRIQDTSSMTYRQLMGNGLQYRVPKFQRDYNWPTAAKAESLILPSFP